MTMYNIRKHKEYGGFLPLELNPGKEYYSEYAANMRRFNSFKAALYFLLNKIKCKKIWVPYYYCPTTINAIKACKLEVEFYHINKNFFPCDLENESDCAVLLVNYFGVSQTAVEKMLRKINGAKVIIDNAHAFFSKPIIQKNIYNIYSAKKFFGVPDGAYLISEEITSDCDVESCSLKYVDYLIKSYELGTNAAYQDKKNADKYIAKNYAPMSKLALGLLRNVDYNRAQHQRYDNFDYMRQAFFYVNELSITCGYSAYLFPLLLKGKGQFLKKKLVEKKIYVPTLWNDEKYARVFNEFETYMAQDALFLPVDQRYDVLDMEYIVSCVREII